MRERARHDTSASSNLCTTSMPSATIAETNRPAHPGQSKWTDFGSLDGRLPGIPRLAHGHVRVAVMYNYLVDARAGTSRHFSELQPLHNSMLSSFLQLLLDALAARQRFLLVVRELHKQEYIINYRVNSRTHAKRHRKPSQMASKHRPKNPT